MGKEIIEGFRLSPQQRHVWALQQAAKGQPYRTQCVVLIEGDLKTDILEAACAQLVRRHEILRTVFHAIPESGLPLQVVTDAEISLDKYDFQDIPASEYTTRLESHFIEARRKHFDFESGLPLRLSLIKLSPAVHHLIIVLPAMCADSASLDVLVRELGQAYASCLGASSWPDEPMQYADVSEWLNELIEAAGAESQKEFWQSQDVSSQQGMKVYGERRPEVRQDFTPRTLTISLDSETVSKINRLVSRQDTSVDLFLLTCWQILLFRLTHQTRIMVGAAHDGRRHEELNNAVGLFARHLPVELMLDDDAQLEGLLRQVGASMRDAHQLQEFFCWEKLGPLTGDASATPFFYFCFEFAAWPCAFSVHGLTFSIQEMYACLDRFKIKLHCIRKAGSLDLEFHYDENAFPRETIGRIAEEFHTLLNSALRHGQSPIGAFEVVGESERRLLSGFGKARAARQERRCVHHMFEAQVEQTPDQIALAFEGQQLSYRELNSRANQLAHHLLRLGVRPETRVALYVNRSLEMVIGMLAVMKAGGVYVPLDPLLPAERLKFMLDHSDARLLLTQRDLIGSFPQHESQVLCIDSCSESFSREGVDNPCAPVRADNAVYVLFTSGTTGQPKGVLIEHRQLANYITGITSELELEPGSSYALVSTFAADLGYTVIFPAICTGGCLHIMPLERATDPGDLAVYFQNHPVDYLKIVPSHLNALLSSRSSAYLVPRRKLILGGEAPGRGFIEKLRRLSPGCRIVNHYGPTETTVGVVTHQVDMHTSETDAATVPLGRPIANTEVYVLDTHLQLLPVGVEGELYIGGAGLARAYINRPDLSADSFIPHPYTQEAGQRLYRSGDKVRWGGSGELEFIGRQDGQVKVRGNRVEIGEVECAIAGHEGVSEAVVMAQEEEAGGTRLLAYVVPDEGSAFTVRKLLRLEGQRLPAGSSCYELPNGMAVIHKNKSETDFLYREIFEAKNYLKGYIAISPGDLIFDVGAHIGLFSLFANSQSEGVFVYAFEPIPSIFDVLVQNLGLYRANAKLFNCGLAERPGCETFTYYPHISLMSGRYASESQEREVLRAFLSGDEQTTRLIEQDESRQLLDELLAERLTQEQVVCQLRTISDVICEYAIERIDLLKIDVQKSEWDVLAGISEQDWAKIRQIALEAHDFDGRVAQITELLGRHGYAVTVEQKADLKDTCLYDIFAVRPSDSRRTLGPRKERLSNSATKAWTGPGQFTNDLRQFIQKRLPEYMIPSSFFLTEALPLTPSGKVDRQALHMNGGVNYLSSNIPVAPTTVIEEEVAEVWAEVLKRKQVSIHDDFFAIGGHSLLAIQLISRLRDRFQVEIPLRMLFESPTVARLSRALVENEPAPGQTEKIAHLLKKVRLMSADEVRDALEQKSLFKGEI